jgi:GntR family transcriptional repressor for pyruvate dehydrogenase complex
MKTELVLEQPRKVTVVESIVEQIVRQIQAGKIKPGDRLPSERQLIEILRVSRSSVREALQGLARKGLIESRPGQGTFVSDKLHLMAPNIGRPGLSASLQREMRMKLIEARRTVECTTARLAAERASDESIARLTSIFEEYRETTLHGSYQRALSGPHHDFHIGLAEMTQNPFYAPVVETLLRAIPQGLRESEFIALGVPDPQSILQVEIEIHQAILDAVASRDGAAAARAMENHMAFEERLVDQALADTGPVAETGS